MGKKELDIGIHREIESDEVVVLPLVMEKCEIPSFLQSKVYADFCSQEEYKKSLQKLLRRLRK